MKLVIVVAGLLYPCKIAWINLLNLRRLSNSSIIAVVTGKEYHTWNTFVKPDIILPDISIKKLHENIHNITPWVFDKYMQTVAMRLSSSYLIYRRYMAIKHTSPQDYILILRPDSTYNPDLLWTLIKQHMNETGLQISCLPATIDGCNTSRHFRNMSRHFRCSGPINDQHMFGDGQSIQKLFQTFENWKNWKNLDSEHIHGSMAAHNNLLCRQILHKEVIYRNKTCQK